MIRGIWTRETVAMVFLAALLPVAVSWIWDEGVLGTGRLVFVFVLAGLWQALFTFFRAQSPSAAGAVSAFAIAVLAPEVGPLQLAIGVSFGFVFARDPARLKAELKRQREAGIAVVRDSAGA